ncbi:MAG: 3-phosphoshikimate 1-carboxyvinyltransferase, partial [Thermoguttaceae bacterium]
LEKMGCSVEWSRNAITVSRAPSEPLHGIDVDMNDIPDVAQTLAVAALFADSPTVIRNVANMRVKETDRLAALCAELRKLGADVEERPDGLTVDPTKRPLQGASIATYDDHRMAMSFALAGLRIPGVVIENPECVAKTYPNFFDDLEKATLPLEGD